MYLQPGPVGLFQDARKQVDVPNDLNDLNDRIDCAVGIVAADIFLDGFKIQASCAGPL